MNKGDLIDSAASLPVHRKKGDSTDSSDRDIEAGRGAGVSAPSCVQPFPLVLSHTLMISPLVLARQA